MPYGTVNADSLVSSDGGVISPNINSLRNRIINGAMVIDQRNAGASVTPANSYTLDRWQGVNTQASKFTVQQNAASVTPPAGFSNYLGVTSSSAYSVLTGDTFCIVQNIEGFNTADLDFGKASASTVTLSFRVYSSLTGTFGGALTNNAANRSYPFSYSVPAANTWTTISVTIAGDTSGTWVGATNGLGLIVRFGLGSGATFSGTAGAWSAGNFVQPTGSVSVVGTNGATFYITGVQLEKGSVATSFDYRPYGTELALCQRYYYTTGSFSSPLTTGHCRSTTAADFQLPLKATMRTAPTLSSTLGSAYLQVAGNNVNVTSITAQDSSIVDVLSFRTNVASGLTAGYAAVFGGGTTFINASAEL
jgi:hypothetical protein